MPQKVEARWSKVYKTNNICSIVMILVNYLDNIITIIIQKFQTLVRPCKVNYLFLTRLFLVYWDGGRHFIFIFYRKYVVEL